MKGNNDYFYHLSTLELSFTVWLRYCSINFVIFLMEALLNLWILLREGEAVHRLIIIHFIITRTSLETWFLNRKCMHPIAQNYPKYWLIHHFVVFMKGNNDYFYHISTLELSFTVWLRYCSINFVIFLMEALLNLWGLLNKREAVHRLMITVINIFIITIMFWKQ